MSDLLDSPIVAAPLEYEREIMRLKSIAASSFPWEVISKDFCQTGNGGYAIYKTHLMAHEWDGNAKTIFIQRDPRDVAVSAAHYLNIPLWDVLRNMCVESSAPFDKTRHVLLGLGLPHDPFRIEDAFFNQKFSRVAPKYPHSMRKGIVGDWRNHFDRKHGKMITEHLGELMIQQGYIDSLDWWKGIQ
jgi:hypothetical protein